MRRFYGCVFSIREKKVIASASHLESKWCKDMLQVQAYNPPEDRYYIIAKGRLRYEFEKIKGFLKILS